MSTERRRVGLLIAGAIAAVMIAIPVLGADPSPSGGPPGQSKPEKSGKPDKATNPGQQKKAAKDATKAAKTPEVDVTVTGTVQQGTDDKGRPTFTLTSGATTWDLSAGPSWYWGDKNPLAAYAGKSVTIAGSHHEGSSELDVATVGGTAIRAAGKPPWAGGPWKVGPTHPGYKDWMADGKGKPGHGKKKAAGAAQSAKPGS